MSYTSIQRELVTRVGGRLFTEKIRLVFHDYVDEGDLILRIVNNDPTKIVFIGALQVDSGYECTSFKCKVGRYEYCRHDPVKWTEMWNPIVVNVAILPSEMLEMWIWTPRNAMLPATFECTVFMCEVPYTIDALDVIMGRTAVTYVAEV